MVLPFISEVRDTPTELSVSPGYNHAPKDRPVTVLFPLETVKVSLTK